MLLPTVEHFPTTDRDILATLPRETIDALYVHIPFCRHKCHYCDFYSITRQAPERMSCFVDLILAELDQWTATQELRPRTIFFGGGTPTLLPLHEMDRLLTGITTRVDCSSIDEWTIEANPATVDADYCRMLRSHGVDRLSFGAQSFDQKALKILERHHDPDDVAHGLEHARSAGFERLSIDLIYAIPDQTLDDWLHCLETALTLRLSHLSCYGLTYESNTAIAVRRRLGQIDSIPEPREIAMFHATRERLSDAGLDAYEISNFAAPGQACQHNLHYWNGGNYAALGPSGASHIGGVRFRNRPHLGEWEQCVAAGALAAIDYERLTPEARAGELIMLQLRLPSGVRFADLERCFDFDARSVFARELQTLQEHQLITVDEVGFRLQPAGLILADAIAGEFISA